MNWLMTDAASSALEWEREARRSVPLHFGSRMEYVGWMELFRAIVANLGRIEGWREAVHLAPELEPEGYAFEEDPSVGTNALTQPARTRPFEPLDFAVVLEDFVGGWGDEDPEFSLAVVGGVDDGHFAAEGAESDAGPSDELDGRPAFELETDGASRLDDFSIGASGSGLDQGHVIAVDPEFHHATGGVGDEGADGGTRSEEGAFCGLEAEDDAVARGEDSLSAGLVDLDVERGEGVIGGGKFGAGGFAEGEAGVDGAAQVGFGPFEQGLGLEDVGAGAVAFEGGDFEFPAGGEASVILMQGADSFELKFGGADGEAGDFESVGGGGDREREGAFLFLDLLGEESDAFIGGGASEDGGGALGFEMGEELGVVVGHLDQEVSLLDFLSFNNGGAFDATGEGGFDGDGAFKWVVGDDAACAPDELLPREEDDGEDQEAEDGEDGESEGTDAEG